MFCCCYLLFFDSFIDSERKLRIKLISFTPKIHWNCHFLLRCLFLYLFLSFWLNFPFTYRRLMDPYGTRHKYCAHAIIFLFTTHTPTIHQLESRFSILFLSIRFFFFYRFGNRVARRCCCFVYAKYCIFSVVLTARCLSLLWMYIYVDEWKIDTKTERQINKWTW